MSKKDKLSVEPYKGVRDFYPEDQAFLTFLKTTCARVVERFGYVEYHASVLEPAELYRSKNAENEEIVNEQTYTFVDRGGREVTLRPEMTPSVARMVAARRREFGYPLRLYSIPNLFRYERPQRGRLREHWQLNVDLFGSHSLAAEAEMITLAHELLVAFGATSTDFVIKVNSRAYLNRIMDELDMPQEKRGGFLYLLDRRAKMPAKEFEAELANYGVSLSTLSTEQAPDDVAQVLNYLQEAGITNVVFDTSVVRGFSYYTGVIFEVFDMHPDNNRSLFGGGRYDNLTALFDDDSVTGVGFGMGDVTIQDFLSVRGLVPPYVPPTMVYIAITDPSLLAFASQVAQRLRHPDDAALPGTAVAMDFGEKKLTDQIKTATKHMIPYLLVIGEKERDSGVLIVRDLATGHEEHVTVEKLAEYVHSLKPAHA
jgi:histidyl-tRNA synthetase